MTTEPFLTPADERYARLRADGMNPYRAALQLAPAAEFDNLDLWIDMRECSLMVQARIEQHRRANTIARDRHAQARNITGC